MPHPSPVNAHFSPSMALTYQKALRFKALANVQTVRRQREQDRVPRRLVRFLCLAAEKEEALLLSRGGGELLTWPSSIPNTTGGMNPQPMAASEPSQIEQWVQNVCASKKRWYHLPRPTYSPHPTCASPLFSRTGAGGPTQELPRH